MSDLLQRTQRVVASIRRLLTKPVTFHEVLKWNPNQIRNPAGTKEGGRWARSTGGRTIGPGDEAWKRRGWTDLGSASHADIMNAPMGTGFGNFPRMTGFGPEAKEALAALASPPKPQGSAFVKIASGASVADAEMLGDESNANITLKVTLDDADGTEAAYKPERGENWDASFANGDINNYVTNKEFSLAEREAFAYEAGDALFGNDNPVPETVHRTDVPGVDLDNFAGNAGSGTPDSYDLRQEYDSYLQSAQEKAMDEVGEEMGNRFEAYVKEVGKRREEIKEIWDEVIQDYPEIAAREAGREHPTLPMGTQQEFLRKYPELLDPVALIKEADVDPEAPFNATERKELEAVIRKHIEEDGAEGIDHFDELEHHGTMRDKWLEDHQDTEAKLLDSKVQGFDEWKRKKYGGGSGGSADVNNPDAPHPNGGSLQKFIDGMNGYGTMEDEEFYRVAVLDYAIGTMDRHQGNLRYDADGKTLAIDNGYSMPGGMSGHDAFTFRSNSVKSWLRGSDPKELPQAFRDEMKTVLRDVDRWKALVDRHPNMSADEREAFLERIDRLWNAMSTPRGLHELWLNVGGLMY